MTGHGVMKIVL